MWRGEVKESQRRKERRNPEERHKKPTLLICGFMSFVTRGENRVGRNICESLEKETKHCLIIHEMVAKVVWIRVSSFYPLQFQN